MFTSLELGRGEEELERGGLSLRKNPLLVSIIDGVETLKALLEKGQLKPEDVAGAKALITMRTDKVRGVCVQLWMRPACRTLRKPHEARCPQAQRHNTHNNTTTQQQQMHTTRSVLASV